MKLVVVFLICLNLLIGFGKVLDRNIPHIIISAMVVALLLFCLKRLEEVE